LKPKIASDLIVVGIISLLLIPVVLLFTSSIPRIILGIPFVLFCPGYALIAALFPAGDMLKGIERIAYSIALSFAIIALLGLLLNYVWEISLYPMLIVLEIEVFLALGAAWYRRTKLPEARRFTLNIKWTIPWKGKSTIDKVLVMILVVVIIGAVITSVFVYNKNIQGLTEFYLLGADGKAEDYPQALLIGEKAKVTLVIVNKERKPMTYRLAINQENGSAWIDDELKKEITVSLDDGQEWRASISFVFNQPGTGEKLDFLLFKGEETEPYLETYLKLDINS
jgi:uncharacterized membrane protein